MSNNTDPHWEAARQELADAAAKAGIDPGTMAKIAGFESQYDPHARPIASHKHAELNTVRQFDGVRAISSAYGYGQFTDVTWANMIRQYGEKYGVANASQLTDTEANSAYLRTNSMLQASMLAEFTRKNIGKGAELGGSNVDANVYALHNLGESTGAAFLEAVKSNPNSRVDAILPKTIIERNPALYGDGSQTIEDAYRVMGQKMGHYAEYAEDIQRVTPNLTTIAQPVTTRHDHTPDGLTVSPHRQTHQQIVLKESMHGDDVRALQAHLAQLGYTGTQGHLLRPDGDFGPITHEAVQSFQRDHLLIADGIVGANTARVLEQQTHNPMHKEQALASQQVESQLRLQEQKRLLDEQHQAQESERDQARDRIANCETVPASTSLPPMAASQSPPIPEHLLDFRHPSHPLHAAYAGVLDAVHVMEDNQQIPHGQESEKLAAALTHRIVSSRFEDGPAHDTSLFHALDRVELRDRDTAIAIEPRENYSLAPKEVPISINQALSQTVPRTSEIWARWAMPHLFEPTPVHQSVPNVDIERLAEYDLRRPDHPQHRQYQTLRECVAQAYARDGLPVSDEHLERATAALAVERQRLEIREPVTLRLIHQPHLDNAGAQSSLIMSEPLPNGYTVQAEVTANAMQAPPEHSYQQLNQVVQQQAVGQQQWQFQQTQNMSPM